MEDVREAANEMALGTHTGMRHLKAKLVVQVSYGDIEIFDAEKGVKDRIEIPIIVVDGSCGGKHLIGKLADGKSYDLGNANFKNTCKRRSELREAFE